MKIIDALQHVAVDRFDAEILLSFLLNQPRSYLYAWPDHVLTPDQTKQFAFLIKRLTQGEPVAYITNEREFWSLPFTVNHHTLIPRPETEILIETILKLPFHYDEVISVADLGTGSGAIAIALAMERPHWRIYATDISAKALSIAKKNAARFKLSNVSFYQGNWCDALPKLPFEIIVANPPYIAEAEWPAYARGLAFEPKLALVSGQDGLDAIREISLQANEYLRSFGFILLEHGFKQGANVADIYTKEGFQDIVTIQDHAGHARATIGRYLPSQ